MVIRLNVMKIFEGSTKMLMHGLFVAACLLVYSIPYVLGHDTIIQVHINMTSSSSSSSANKQTHL